MTIKLTQRILRKASRLLSPSPIIAGDDVEIGANVEFGRNVVLNCKRLRIGDNVRFGDNVTVNATDFEIGDYGTIYESCFFPGPGKLRIGHNFWLGTGSVVDCAGGTTIGDNVGAGAHSQLWSHIRFGDLCYGCRFQGTQPLVIEHDVWLVGHCLVSPVRIGARAIAMLGSVITGDLEPDRCYAGVPARDITDRVGPQFAIRAVEDRVRYLEERLVAFAADPRNKDARDRIVIVSSATAADDHHDNVTVFNAADRTYHKRSTPLEQRFMRFLLPDAKFIPHGRKRLDGINPTKPEPVRRLAA